MTTTTVTLTVPEYRATVADGDTLVLIIDKKLWKKTITREPAGVTVATHTSGTVTVEQSLSSTEDVAAASAYWASASTLAAKMTALRFAASGADCVVEVML